MTLILFAAMGAISVPRRGRPHDVTSSSDDPIWTSRPLLQVAAPVRDEHGWATGSFRDL